MRNKLSTSKLRVCVVYEEEEHGKHLKRHGVNKVIKTIMFGVRVRTTTIDHPLTAAVLGQALGPGTISLLPVNPFHAISS